MNTPGVGNSSGSLKAPLTEPSAKVALNKARPAPAILWGGLIAGASDISYACIDGLRVGRPVARTLQSVASGLLGRAALEGGWESAGLGLLLHFSIAMGAATTYYAASRKVAILTDRPWTSGVLFGALVYLFMNLIVVPLSAAPFRIPLRIPGLLVHMFFVGLPIAVCVGRYSSRCMSAPKTPVAN
jgi:hypothetical protein